MTESKKKKERKKNVIPLGFEIDVYTHQVQLCCLVCILKYLVSMQLACACTINTVFGVYDRKFRFTYLCLHPVLEDLYIYC